MLFKGKLLVSIASVGVVGGTSAGIYYSKIKSEKNEELETKKEENVVLPKNELQIAPQDQDVDLEEDEENTALVDNPEKVIAEDQDSAAAESGESTSETEDPKAVESIEWTDLVPANQINS